ncbi:MAG: T9SS type A sorting domain-containing protein [Bacteroidota bacterium]|nr:T9SS type A sorting domain-containing protein [Bacteroidota bacterium]
MKKQILLIAVLFLFLATNSYSQFGASKGKLDQNFNSNWKGRTTDFDANASNCGTVHTGTYTGTIIVNLDNSPDVPFYCLDLCTNINLGDSIVDSASTIPQAIHITNNYYPAAPNVLPSVDDEACAVQLAIWHFRNALVISSVTMNGGDVGGSDIRARAQTIVDETILNGGSSVNVSTLEIVPAANPDDFFIRTLDTAGNPIAVNGIELSISNGGTLSETTVNTNASGISPDVIVTGANNGSEIFATAHVQIPGGITYSGLSAIKQLLVLGRTTMGLRTATLLWGALPVELTSFSAIPTNGNVTLNWNTTSEINNSGFDVERKAFSSDEWTKVGNVAGNGTSTSGHDYTFSDRNLTRGIYTYRLKQIDYNGNFAYHNLNGEVIIGAPTKFDLSQNYPNPFNPSTTINFDMPADGFVSLKVFNSSGKEVATLLNESRTSGYHSVNFKASNLSSGIYYYRLEANGVSKVMKMALVK